MVTLAATGLERDVQMNLTKHDLFMSRATPIVALSFREIFGQDIKTREWWSLGIG